jgi:hypothetical protein
MISGTRVRPRTRNYSARPLAGFAQALSVIADEEGDCALEQVARLEEAEDATDAAFRPYSPKR